MKNRIKQILINLKSDEEHILNDGATYEDIENAQKLISTQIPQFYVDFLSQVNGATFRNESIILYQVSTGSKKPNEYVDLVFRNNQSVIMSYPQNVVTIGCFNFGDTIFVRPVDNQSIYVWDHETGTYSIEWNSIEDFLNDWLEG